MTGCSGVALTIGGNLIPYLYKKKGINFAFDSGILFCLFSCAIAYAFLCIERYLDKKNPKKTVEVVNE
jgi:hypothetical protein